MNYSLNEISTLAKKSARGAGYHWGFSEEVAAAARWLCSHGLDGANCVSRLLVHNYACNLADHSPIPSNTHFACDGWLCPISSGTILCDNPTVLKAKPFRVIQLDLPELLLPFISQISIQIAMPITVNSDGVIAVIDGDNLSLSGKFGTKASVLTVTIGGTTTALQPRCTRVNISDDDYDMLSLYASYTYAPATDMSRLLGAGAGILDND